MAPRRNSHFIKHKFGGGWATDFGPTASVPIQAGGVVVLPWLNEAQNVIYELDGGPHKMPGRTLDKGFSGGGATRNMTGVFDAWFHGAVGSPTQRRMVQYDARVRADNADNVFADVFTGLTTKSVPCFTMFEDLLIYSNDSGTDVPKSWDGTTAQSLAGSPPTFAFSCAHKNRMFAAGAVAQPSRLYYSILLNGADWTGGGSGTIDIDPSDGDRITAIASHRDSLWVFKGPNKGSIHRITGSSSTDFARTTFVTGVGAVAHRTVVPYANDLAFMWSDASIRTLSATNQFGDFNEESLTRPIQSWLRDHVTIPSLKFAQIVDWPSYSFLVIILPIDASTSCNAMLMMDYRFDPPRFANWTAYNDVTSIASAGGIDTNKTRTILAGGILPNAILPTVALRTLGSSTRTSSQDSAGVGVISYNVQTPYLDYEIPQRMKTLERASLTINPKTAGSSTFGWTRDNNTQQTQSVAQGGADVLGVFLLGTSLLGGGKFYENFFATEEGGEFRAIQYQVLDNVDGQDIEVHGISAMITVGAESFEA